MLAFPPFKLDLVEERLWKGNSEVAVRRKPFAILKFLVKNPRRLVTYAELLEHVWEGSIVSESTIRTQVHELRQALGEGVIETVIGRGYRFTVDVSEDRATEPAPMIVERIVVGRDRELKALRGCFERADTGHRQLCFVTGEPGIGKTTLVDALFDGLPAGTIAVRGHCVEQHGAPESYLAVIELLGRLRDGVHGQKTLDALVHYAPMFLAQVPRLVPTERLDEVRDRARGGTEARMVRELIDALEMLASQTTLVLVLEDLQWSDVATLDLLALLGARRERARLLVVATSRRAEAQTVTHPLNPVMRNLVVRGGAVAVSLDRVGLEDLRELLELRFPDHGFPPELVETLDKITGGTPLFAVSVLDDLVNRDMIVQRDGRWSLTASIDDVRAHRPGNVKQLIDIRLDRLEASEQRVLEAASVVGAEFSCGLVAAALEMSVEQVDDICDGLARRSLFLRRETGEPWPDGTLHTHYAVTHGLVQEVCAARSAPARRQRWHRLVAETLERVYAGRLDDVAHALAMHHERGQSIARAVDYYVTAADRTTERFASHDALALYRRGVELLERVPDGRDRDLQELRLFAGIVAATLRTSDPSSAELIAQLERMIVLASRLDDRPRLCAALLNLAFRYQLLADHRRGAEIGKDVEALVESSSLHPALARFATAMIALNRMWMGKLDGVADVFEGILAAKDTLEERSLGILGPTDRRTVIMNFLALARWLGGDVERARIAADGAVAQARATNDPFGLGLALVGLAWLRCVSNDTDESVCAPAREVLTIAGTELWRPTAEILITTTQVDPALARKHAESFRSSIPAIPLGTTRLGLVVARMLARSGLAADAKILVDDLLVFAETHEERVVEAQLRTLQTAGIPPN